MAKSKGKRRTAAARIYLTATAFRQVEAAAFKNCRTVPQELTFMVESLLSKKWANPPAAPAYTSGPERYDDPPAPDDAGPASDSAAGPEKSAWAPEQEARALEAGAEKGLSAAQVTAIRLIYKHHDAVMAAIDAEEAGAPTTGPAVAAEAKAPAVEVPA